MKDFSTTTTTCLSQLLCFSYIAASLPAEAARVLSTRGDQSSLTTALKVSVISDENQLASSLAVRVLHICLETGNWDAGHKALALCTGVEGHLFAFCVHELLVNELLQGGYVQDCDFKEKISSELFSVKVNGKNKMLDSLIESITERESASLPWLLEMPTKDWFIGRVLKAWNRVGDLTSQHSILEPAMQQLLVYCQSNLNENLSMKQVLIRISYDISLGLLRGITQDNYSCSLPWLQALETCCKSSFLGFYFLPQFLCVLLLPRGTQSLKDVSSVRTELMNPAEEQSFIPVVQPSDDEIFSFFVGFYNLILLYKIWWRDPAVMKRFHRHVCPDNGADVDQIVFGNGRFLPSNNVFKENQSDKATVRPLKDNSSGVEATLSVGDNNNSTATSKQLQQESDSLLDFSKEPLSSETSPNEIPSDDPKERLDLQSVISRVRDVLLHKDRVICSALKEQLLEVKKQIILLRSRRILDSVVVNKVSTKKKRSSKKKENQMEALKDSAGNLGFKGAEMGKDDEMKNGKPAHTKENGSRALNEATEELSRPLATEEDKLEGGNTENSDKGGQSCRDVEMLTAPTEPLDVRYKGQGWTLELMQREEQRLLEELSTYPLKELPFPNPAEVALVIGHLCSHVDTLQCHEPAVLHQLGLEAVKSTLEHAQWEQELKCLKRLNQKLTGLEMAGQK